MFISLRKPGYRLFICVLVIQAIVYIPALCGQPPTELYFNHLKQEDGLPTADYNYLLQDSSGFIWATSASGLIRYDGRDIKVYNQNRENGSLSYTVCSDIILDKYNTMWVGTQHGLSRYNRKTDNFTRFKMPYIDSAFNSGADRFYQGLVTDQSGNPVFIDEAGVVATFNYTTSEVVPLLNRNIKDPVKSAYTDENGYIWAGTTNGLAQVNLQEQSIRYFPLSYNNSNNTIWSITREKNKLWLCSPHCPKVFTFDLQSKTYDTIDISGNINIESINSVYKNKEGNLWFSTSQGIINYNPNNQQKKVYLLNNNRMSNENITFCVMEDAQNNIWVGQLNGISHATLHNNFFILTSEKDQLQTPVNALAIDNEGNYWTAGYGYNQLQISDAVTHKIVKEIEHINLFKANSTSTFELFISSTNEVYIGTYKNGLLRANTSFTQRYKYTPGEQPNSIAGYDVRDIKEDRNGNLWMICHGYGFNKFNPATQQFTNYNISEKDKKGLGEMWFFDLLIDKNNHIWLSHTNGVSHFNPENEQFTHYSHNINDTNSISSNNATGGFALVANNNFWVATQYGLNYFNRRNEKFTRFYKKDGLLSNMNRTIVFDADSNLWVGHDNGLSRLNFLHPTRPKLNEMKVKTYKPEDGIGSLRFSRSTFAKDTSGSIILAGNRGLTIVNTQHFKDNKYPPKIIFKDFILHNKRVPINDTAAGFSLEKHINETKIVHLNYNQNVFGISYLGVNYYQNHNNQYAYILEGFDKAWNYVGQKTEAEYRNVPPGKYTFLLKAANYDGYWTTQARQLIIFIHPPWWRTWWFIILVALTISGLITSAVFARIKSLKKQKEQLQIEVDRQTRNLIKQTEALNNLNTQLEERQQFIEEQSEELQVQKDELYKKNIALTENNSKLNVLNETKDTLFSIIAHDLKSPFSSLLGLIELLIRNYYDYTDKKRYEFINGVSISANTIFNLLENLLHWARTQTKSITFTPDHYVLNNILNNCIQLYKQNATQKKIFIQNNIKENTMVYGDKYMLETVFRNILNNAIKYTQNGTITFDASINNKSIICLITDTGIGMSPEQLKSLFVINKDKSTLGTTGEKGTGLGLIICHEFIKYHKGNITVSSAPGKGTTFNISLPYHKK